MSRRPNFPPTPVLKIHSLTRQLSVVGEGDLGAFLTISVMIIYHDSYLCSGHLIFGGGAKIIFQTIFFLIHRYKKIKLIDVVSFLWRILFRVNLAFNNFVSFFFCAKRTQGFEFAKIIQTIFFSDRIIFSDMLSFCGGFCFMSIFFSFVANFVFYQTSYQI